MVLLQILIVIYESAVFTNTYDDILPWSYFDLRKQGADKKVGLSIYFLDRPIR